MLTTSCRGEGRLREFKQLAAIGGVAGAWQDVITKVNYGGYPEVFRCFWKKQEYTPI
jgi:hypothetical protein